VQSGESFSITLYGHEAAKLLPPRGPNQADIQEAIVRMKETRSVLNPPGKEKLRIKDLTNEGRP
jgi:hypothetical protein